LAPYAVEVRYPGEIREVSRAEAEGALSAAEAVWQFVLNLLPFTIRVFIPILHGRLKMIRSSAKFLERPKMKATAQDRARLEQKTAHLVEQLKAMGAKKIVLFGSLARGELSLFSDIDLLVLFDDDRPSRELTRAVYQQIKAYSRQAMVALQERPLFRDILSYGKVLYEEP
jgi:predicted nucleotidyltransferase